jgi:hypothetical protein
MSRLATDNYYTGIADIAMNVVLLGAPWSIPSAAKSCPSRTFAILRDQSATGFRSTPMPSTSTSTTSPGWSGPTPAGVPVMITSPGSSVMMLAA